MATPRPELAEAVWTLLEADPARIVALASSLRAPNRWIESTVAGVSMARVLPPGSRIRIELIDRSRYDIGEVVAFLDLSQVVVHRVVHRGRGGAAEGYVLARGDSVLVPDPPFPHDRILGPVTGVWREGRWMGLGGAPRHPLRARVPARLALWAAVGALSLSPRATAKALSLLKRGERALRFAFGWGFKRHTRVSELR